MTTKDFHVNVKDLYKRDSTKWIKMSKFTPLSPCGLISISHAHVDWQFYPILLCKTAQALSDYTVIVSEQPFSSPSTKSRWIASGGLSHLVGKQFLQTASGWPAAFPILCQFNLPSTFTSLSRPAAKSSPLHDAATAMLHNRDRVLDVQCLMSAIMPCLIVKKYHLFHQTK